MYQVFYHQNPQLRLDPGQLRCGFGGRKGTTQPQGIRAQHWPRHRQPVLQVGQGIAKFLQSEFQPWLSRDTSWYIYGILDLAVEILEAGVENYKWWVFPNLLIVMKNSSEISQFMKNIEAAIRSTWINSLGEK